MTTCLVTGRPLEDAGEPHDNPAQAAVTQTATAEARASRPARLAAARLSLMIRPMNGIGRVLHCFRAVGIHINNIERLPREYRISFDTETNSTHKHSVVCDQAIGSTLRHRNPRRNELNGGTV
jgi:hypothetical protein